MYGRVELIRALYGAADTPITLMGVERVSKSMLAKVGFGIRRDRSAQQGQPHHVVANIPAVLAVRQQRHAVVAFAQIRPLVRAALEAGPVPTRIPMRGAHHVAELDVVGREAAADVDRERHLEQGLALYPIDRGVKVDAVEIAVAANTLTDRAAAPKSTHDLDRPAYRTDLAHLDSGDRLQRRHLLLVVDIDVPGVPLHRP